MRQQTDDYREIATGQAATAHAAYRTQEQQLIDEQVTALFALLSGVLARVAPDATVERGDHVLHATRGGHTIDFTVEAVTDLPVEADRSRVYPASHARCVLRAPDGSTTEWALRRVGAGDDTRYAWMQTGTGTLLDQQEGEAAVRSAWR